jgi:hypothetical protein
MPLLTDELKARLPALYSQEDVADPTVQVLLVARNGWMWALTEYSDTAPDGCPNLAFGKVYGDFPELGYVPMDELDELAADGLVWVEDDFVPRTLSELDAVHGAEFVAAAMVRAASRGLVPVKLV